MARLDAVADRRPQLMARLRLRLRLLATRSAIVVVIAASAMPASSASAQTRQRVNFSSIESQFICTSCHEPLELVSSPQAQAEKTYLQGLINQGLSAAQIRSNMVDQYGVAVLGKPPASGFNLTVYVLPPAVLAFGIVLLVVTLPKWRARSRRAAETPLEHAQQLDGSEAKRLDDDLARFI